jgi:3-hydroxybutyryl-CoA dehydrogenase
MNNSKSLPSGKPVGLIGLGLMGRGIASCLLARGFQVVAYNRTASRAEASLKHIGHALDELARRKVVPRSAIANWKKRYRLTDSIAGLRDCFFVVETVKEDEALKHEIYDQLEQTVKARTVIASNTSSIPITLLQKGRRHPERFIGMHWGEPAEIMQYLEIIPGDETSRRTIELTKRVGAVCGKMPTVLNFDIRGFISNRLMYAMLREAFHLVEAGVADIETIDRSYRNDMGWWSTIAGPFRWMDLTGIPAYMTVMEGLLPELENTTKVPKLMRAMVKSGALGIANQKGFYKYTKAEAAQWEKAWVEFTYDIRGLAEKYQKQVKF